MSKKSKFKHRFILSLLFFGLFVGFILQSCKENTSNNHKTSKQDTTSSNVDMQNKRDHFAKNVISFDDLDTVPRFPEDEKIESKERAIGIFKKRMLEFVSDRFDMERFSNVKGLSRITVNFTIDKEGKVKNIDAHGLSLEMENEAVRVIRELPVFRAGTKNGEVVDAGYTFPIMFKRSHEH